MHFSPRLATSSELTVHDLIVQLPSHHSAIVYGQDVDDPYTDISCLLFPRRTKFDDRILAYRISQAISKDDTDIIVVEQHLPTAVKIHHFLSNVPILLHRHNDYDPPHKNKFRRWIQSRRFKSIAGIAFVSEHSRQHFLAHWGSNISCQTYVIPNGLNLSRFNPFSIVDRSSEILFVGRSIPEKGGLELARALRHVLPRHSNWQARFIIGNPDTDPDYRQTLISTLELVKNQVHIEYQRPWAEVQYAYEHAAIAVVPSIWDEPFGRTALEAMAGGAALISSTRGGLNEVVEDAAVRLTDITPDTIAAALTDLIDHPEKRAALSTRGLEQAKKFTIETQVEAFLSACRAAIDRKANKAVRR